MSHVTPGTFAAVFVYFWIVGKVCVFGIRSRSHRKIGKNKEIRCHLLRLSSTISSVTPPAAALLKHLSILCSYTFVYVYKFTFIFLLHLYTCLHIRFNRKRCDHRHTCECCAIEQNLFVISNVIYFGVSIQCYTLQAMNRHISYMFISFFLLLPFMVLRCVRYFFFHFMPKAHRTFRSM